MDSVIQKYFSILEDYFGKACKEITAMGGHVDNNVNAVTGRHYGSSNGSLVLAESTLETLYEELNNLDWKSQSLDIRKTAGFKVSYIGSEDGFDRLSSAEKFIRKTGLYADTIIINENLLLALFQWKARNLSNGGWKTFSTLPTLIGSAYDILSIKNLFISDCNRPLCSLAPSSLLSAKEESLISLQALSDNATTSFASEYFGKKFSSTIEIENFLSDVNPEMFIALSRKPSLLVKADGQQITCDSIIESVKGINETFRRPIRRTDVYLSILGSHRLHIIAELMRNSKYRSSFATDRRGYWDNLLWLFKQDNYEILKQLSNETMLKRMGIIYALQQEKLNWLGNVPLSGIKALRERGEMNDIREVLGKNITEIQSASDDNFEEIGLQVKYNIEQAMIKHSAQVKDLSEKYKRMLGFGVGEAGTIAASGTLNFIASPYPPIAMAAGIVLGLGFSIKTCKEYLSWRSKLKELRTKPVALLFDTYTKNEPSKEKSQESACN